MFNCLQMVFALVVVAAVAEPEAKADPIAEPQYYPAKPYAKPYSPPAYPAYPEPAYGKPAYPSYDYKPTYGAASYKKDNYCDPRAPPKCAQHASNATFCLQDQEYPEQEVQVTLRYSSQYNLKQFHSYNLYNNDYSL